MSDWNRLRSKGQQDTVNHYCSNRSLFPMTCWARLMHWRTSVFNKLSSISCPLSDGLWDVCSVCESVCVCVERWEREMSSEYSICSSTVNQTLFLDSGWRERECLSVWSNSHEEKNTVVPGILIHALMQEMQLHKHTQTQVTLFCIRMKSRTWRSASLLST